MKANPFFKNLPMDQPNRRGRIFLSPPHMSGNELTYIGNAFEKNYIAPIGENVDLFESSIANFVGIPNVLATNTGTAAIHLALILAGVGPGDVVICQSFTFAASANPIKYLGATPVFVDSEEETWNMDSDYLREAIETTLAGELGNHSELDEVKKLKPQLPKAIIVVHLYGMPAKMDELCQLGKKYGIPIIEDSAEAIGSSINGKQCGTFGEYGIYSFNGNKIITTSGGGALVSNNKKAIEQARNLSAQARDSYIYYQHSKVGYNYKMSNISAGIGVAQMEVLDSRVESRRENFSAYKEFLKDESYIQFLEEPVAYKSNRWLTTILIDKDRGFTPEQIALELESDAIETRPLWKPMHLQPLYCHYPYFGTNLSAALFTAGLCLPSGSALTRETIFMICEKLKELMHRPKSSSLIKM
jgi:dTDP-4-amino-4,6-dideoxygalactose transaminase